MNAGIVGLVFIMLAMFLTWVTVVMIPPAKNNPVSPTRPRRVTKGTIRRGRGPAGDE